MNGPEAFHLDLGIACASGSYKGVFVQGVLDCFEAAELLHELGHYTLGDPMHSAPAWSGVDARFAPIVWDRPDAPASCVARWRGVTSGAWPVNGNAF